MDLAEHTDNLGRKYQVRVDGTMEIIIGPPEGLVDRLGVPEPIATRLHNILYRRRIFNSRDIARDPKSLLGALQEALMVDVQRLTEAYFEYEKEASHE